MKEPFGGFELDLTEMCFPSPGLGTYVLSKVFFNRHYRIILAAFLGKIYSRILGGVATIFLIIRNKIPGM